MRPPTSRASRFWGTPARWPRPRASRSRWTPRPYPSWLGLIPAGAYRNRDFFGPRVALAQSLPRDLVDVLFDPQTSGGLLLALGEKDAERLTDALRAEGLPASVIGRAVARGEKSVVVA